MLKFWEGWLSIFKRRWGPNKFWSHGAAGDADLGIIDELISDLQMFLSAYQPKNVVNAYECGLEYKMAPDRTIGTEPLPVRKKQKGRFTLMVCWNIDGSERFELMFIVWVQRIEPFNENMATSMG